MGGGGEKKKSWLTEQREGVQGIEISNALKAVEPPENPAHACAATLGLLNAKLIVILCLPEMILKAIRNKCWNLKWDYLSGVARAIWQPINGQCA